MKKKQKRNTKKVWVLGVATIAVLALVLAVACWHRGGTEVSGTVASVTLRPNRAEDGYYAMTVQSGSKTYTIDATGYMNTPMLPEDQGQACVAVPEVSVTDKVSFRLPKAGDDTYATCFKEGADNYYFTVN